MVKCSMMKVAVAALLVFSMASVEAASLKGAFVALLAATASSKPAGEVTSDGVVALPCFWMSKGVDSPLVNFDTFKHNDECPYALWGRGTQDRAICGVEGILFTRDEVNVAKKTDCVEKLKASYKKLMEGSEVSDKELSALVILARFAIPFEEFSSKEALDKVLRAGHDQLFVKRTCSASDLEDFKELVNKPRVQAITDLARHYADTLDLDGAIRERSDEESGVAHIRREDARLARSIQAAFSGSR